MNASIRLKALVQLALVDNSFDIREKNYIMNLGKANNIPEMEIEAIIDEQLKSKEFENLVFMGLSMGQRTEYLVSIIELMKLDGKVYFSEIKFCKKIAEKLGFKKSVVGKLSSRIHSDPHLNPNIELLKKELETSLIAA